MDRGRRKIERHPCTVLGSYEGGGNKPWGVKCLDISAAGAGLASFSLRVDFCHMCWPLVHLFA